MSYSTAVAKSADSVHTVMFSNNRMSQILTFGFIVT